MQGEEQEPSQPSPQAARQEIFDKGDAYWWDGGKKVQPTSTFEARRLDTPLDKMMRRNAGRRSRTYSDRKRGRYILARPAMGRSDDLAFDATLRAAAPFQLRRADLKQQRKVAFAVQPGDYQRKVRVRRAANLVLFLVDASWSMAVAERMSATKGAILSLLTDAYQRRDRVGLITFQKDRALLILPPTNSVQLAERALRDIPVGGKTPLSAGLMMSYNVLRREKILHPDVLPLLIILTDGAGNVALGQQPANEEAHQIAEMVAEAEIHSVVINMEHAAFDQGLAQALAEHLEAPCYALADLKAENLYATVKDELGKLNVIEEKR